MGNPNPLNWNCDDDGCFNRKKRPKIEEFADCFPGNICMGDVDGIVEINGYALMLEWKGGSEMPQGQHIMYKRFAMSGFATVIVICGDPEHMKVWNWRWYFGDKSSDWLTANLEDIKVYIRDWVQWAQNMKSPFDKATR